MTSATRERSATLASALTFAEGGEASIEASGSRKNLILTRFLKEFKI
jgi:hypothetical protein